MPKEKKRKKNWQLQPKKRERKSKIKGQRYWQCCCPKKKKAGTLLPREERRKKKCNLN